MAWQVMTGQERAIIVTFALLALGLVTAVVVGVIRRRRGDVPPPPPVRFVPHWQLMGMLLLTAVMIVVALVMSFLARR